MVALGRASRRRCVGIEVGYRLRCCNISRSYAENLASRCGNPGRLAGRGPPSDRVELRPAAGRRRCQKSTARSLRSPIAISVSPAVAHARPSAKRAAPEGRLCLSLGVSGPVRRAWPTARGGSNARGHGPAAVAAHDDCRVGHPARAQTLNYIVAAYLIITAMVGFGFVRF